MRVSASKIGLLEHCQAFARPEMKWDYSSSPAAERGTRFHAAIAAYTLGNAPVVAEATAAGFEQACKWLRNLTDTGATFIKVEVAFAWDPKNDSASRLDIVDRAYPPTSRLCGTADLVCFIDDVFHVFDWKTGDASNAGPQLRLLGLMASRAFGVAPVVVSALEARADDIYEVGREELDDFALAALAGEVAEQLAAVESAEPKPGSHCSDLYCPARLHCPAATSAMAEVVDTIPAESLVRRPEFRITDPIRTPEQAIYTVNVLRLMSTWIDAKKDEIKKRVPVEGWQADDGQVLKETTARVEALDKHRALALLKQLGATDEQLGGLYYTFEKSNGLRVSKGSTKPRRRTKAA